MKHARQYPEIVFLITFAFLILKIHIFFYLFVIGDATFWNLFNLQFSYILQPDHLRRLRHKEILSSLNYWLRSLDLLEDIIEIRRLTTDIYLKINAQRIYTE